MYCFDRIRCHGAVAGREVWTRNLLGSQILIRKCVTAVPARATNYVGIWVGLYVASPLHVGGRAGTTTLSQSQLYPPVREYKFAKGVTTIPARTTKNYVGIWVGLNVASVTLCRGHTKLWWKIERGILALRFTITVHRTHTIGGGGFFLGMTI